MNTLGIIPARYASSRLEGKPLADIKGKSMIQRVYERAVGEVTHLIVATDDDRIYDHVTSFGGNVVMTSSNHTTGTNRCLEAWQKLETDIVFDVIINIQGDEPLLAKEHLQDITSCFDDPNTKMATLVKTIDKGINLATSSNVYVVLDNNSEALYFSRSIIPALRDYPIEEWTNHHTFYKHIGMYAFKPNSLERFASLKSTSLELAESLEQNRWLQNGNKIKVAVTSKDVIAVDTPEDLESVRRLFD